MLFDSLQHDCGHLLQATSHILNITLIFTAIICVSEADPPSDDSVTTYGCYQIRSNNPPLFQLALSKDVHILLPRLPPFPFRHVHPVICLRI